MKLTVLADNNTFTGRTFVAEPGLSFLIEEQDKRVLFDTGYSDVFLRNAARMGLDLRSLDYIVLSHGHYDHTWGLVSLIAMFRESLKEGLAPVMPRLVTHPVSFCHKYREGIGENGSIVSLKRASSIFGMTLTREPYRITDKLVFLGEIPRRFPFEEAYKGGLVERGGRMIDDEIVEDSALAYVSEQGLVIITGCAHAGICNTIEYAREVCSCDRIADVIGGFHLQNPSEQQLQGVARYMAQLKPDVMHPCHCTDQQSKMALANVARVQETGVGLSLEYR